MTKLGKLASAFSTVGLAAGLATTPITAASNESDTAQAILVLDGSGSMWGRIDETPKISIAVDVIRDLLADWDPNVALGVTAYGHREKGNCADIETLIPVGPVDQNAVMAAIEGLNPKGKTPLTDAVRQAAETLRYTEERATVILVSDGEETCNADPCAVAAELEEAGVDFTTHVVGFDLNAEQKEQLQCLADTTGGAFLSAGNAEELHEAMAETVELVAKPEPAPKRVVKLEIASRGNLIIENYTDNVYIHKVEAEEVSSERLETYRSASAKPIGLPAGTYLLRSSRLDLTQVDIAPGESVVVDVNDFLGRLFIDNVTDSNVYIHQSGSTEPSTKALETFGFATSKPLYLRPGSYALRTRSQDVAEVDISLGKETVVDMNDYFGWLSVENAPDSIQAHEYENGQASSASVGSISQVGSSKPLQLKAGAYMLKMDGQELITVEVVAGEELVIEMGN